MHIKYTQCFYTIVVVLLLKVPVSEANPSEIQQIPCLLEEDTGELEWVPKTLHLTISEGSPTHGRKLNFFFGIVAAGLAAGALAQSANNAASINDLTSSFNQDMEELRYFVSAISSQMLALGEIVEANLQAIEGLTDIAAFLVKNAFEQTWSHSKLSLLSLTQNWLTKENLLGPELVFKTMLFEIANSTDVIQDEAINEFTLVGDTYDRSTFIYDDEFYILLNPFRWIHATLVIPIIPDMDEILARNFARYSGGIYFPHFSVYSFQECFFDQEINGRVDRKLTNPPLINIFDNKLNGDSVDRSQFISNMKTVIRQQTDLGCIRCKKKTPYEYDIQTKHSFNVIITSLINDAALVDTRGAMLWSNPRNFISALPDDCFVTRYSADPWYTHVQGDIQGNTRAVAYPRLQPEGWQKWKLCISIENVAARFAPDPNSPVPSMWLPKWSQQILGAIVSETGVKRVATIKVPAYHKTKMRCRKYRCQTGTPLTFSTGDYLPLPTAKPTYEFCDWNNHRTWSHFVKSDHVESGIWTGGPSEDVSPLMFMGTNEIDQQSEIVFKDRCFDVSQFGCRLDPMNMCLLVKKEDCSEIRSGCTFLNGLVNCPPEYTCYVDDNLEPCTDLVLKEIRQLTIMKGEVFHFQHTNASQSGLIHYDLTVANQKVTELTGTQDSLQTEIGTMHDNIVQAAAELDSLKEHNLQTEQKLNALKTQMTQLSEQLTEVISQPEDTAYLQIIKDIQSTNCSQFANNLQDSLQKNNITVAQFVTMIENANSEKKNESRNTSHLVYIIAGSACVLMGIVSACWIKCYARKRDRIVRTERQISLVEMDFVNNKDVKKALTENT